MKPNPYFKTLIISQLILFTRIGFAQSPSVEFSKLDAYFAKSQKEWGVPGMSVGIVKEGKLVFSKGYGTIEAGKNITPNAQSLYAIASNSKAFTSAIIGILVQEGKLKWDDKVRKYLPYFALYDDYVSEQTTIKDLLSHRVGLGTFSGDIMWYNADFSSEEIIKHARYLKPEYGFRAGFGYSNVMFITAGEIIEKVTGKSWYENVKEKILLPLGMNRTIVNINEIPNLGNAASPHALINHTENKPIPYTSWEEIASTGGLISCVEDLSKWVIFNLNNGINGKDTILTASTRNAVWTLQNSFPVSRVRESETGTTFGGYGLGWFVGNYFGKLRIYHTGGYDGMITSINMLPEEKLGVIVLTNGLKAPIGSIPKYVFDAYLGKPEKDWSKIDLERTDNAEKEDDRVEKLKKNRIANTQPTAKNSELVGTYHTDVYGNIVITEKNGVLEIDFEHTPSLSSTLSHWHYDTYQLNWKKEHPWFTLGLIKFTTDANQQVTGIEFNVPNNDFWFEELNAKKVK